MHERLQAVPYVKQVSWRCPSAVLMNLNQAHGRLWRNAKARRPTQQRFMRTSQDIADDFSFISKMSEDSCCKYYGKLAKEPEMTAKLLVLRYAITKFHEAYSYKPVCFHTSTCQSVLEIPPRSYSIGSHIPHSPH